MIPLGDSNTVSGLDISTWGSRRRRRTLAKTSALSEYEGDLRSNDRIKQKEAMKEYLAGIIRSDWSFQWPLSSPPPSVRSQPSSTLDVDIFGDLSEEAGWREREEWLSDAVTEIGDKQDTINTSSGSGSAEIKQNNSENKELSQVKLETKLQELKRKKKESLREELAYNDGLRCFIARRNVWTGARVTHKLVQISSPRISDGEPVGEFDRESTLQGKCEIEEITKIPIGRPILPAENLVRSSITPRSYNLIYDKVVQNSITPSCPINLRDLIQSCVQGWKRDGQWPQSSDSLTKSLSQKQSNRQVIDNLFPQDESNENIKCTAKECTTYDRNEEQAHRQRGRAMEKKGNNSRERHRGLSSCFSRILGRGS